VPARGEKYTTFEKKQLTSNFEKKNRELREG